MTRTRRPFALALLLAACTTSTATPSTTPDPTPEASPTQTASQGPSESAEPSPDSTPTGGEPGGFDFEANAEADRLFLDRFSCQNLEDGYEVEFPSDWNANAEFGEVAPCSWFAATEYDAGSGSSVPDEVAIEVFVVDGEREYGDAETSERQEGLIGSTQPAFRVRVTDGDDEAYEYVVQLGRSFADGPNLVARTDSSMGGDFELNRAVLDRMMATMEFIGVIQ